MSNRHEETLIAAQALLDVGPSAMADALGTNRNTYKAWLYNVNPTPGIAYVAVAGLLKVRELEAELEARRRDND